MANSTSTVVTSTSVTRPVFPFYPLGPIIGSVPNVPEGYWNAVSWEQRLKWLCQNMAALVDFVNDNVSTFTLPDGVGVLTRTAENEDVVMQLVTEAQLDKATVYPDTSETEGGYYTVVGTANTEWSGDTNYFTWGWHDNSTGYTSDVSDIAPVLAVLDTATHEPTKFIVATGGITSSQIHTNAIKRDNIGRGQVINETIAEHTINRINMGSGSVGYEQIVSDDTADYEPGYATNYDTGYLYSFTDTDDKGYTTYGTKWVSDIEATVADGSITTAKLADGAVTSDKIASHAVTYSELASDSVINTKIHDNAVTTSKLGAYSVTDEKIAQQTITLDKLDPGRFLTGQVEVGSLAAGSNTGVISQTLSYGQTYTTTDGVSQVFLQAYTTANTTIDIVVNSRPNVNNTQTLQFTAYNTGAQNCTDLYIMWLVLNEA